MPRKIIPTKVAEVKNNIIQTSIKLIVEDGFSKFTLTSVAQSIGVTKAAIYWYFPNKDSLIEEIANHVKNNFIGLAQEIINMQLTSQERLVKVLSHSASDNLLCILPIKMFLEYYSEENTIKEIILENYLEYIDIIANILKNGVATGEFDSSIQIDKMAKFIVGGMDGISLQSTILKEEYSVLVKHFTLITLEMILQRKEQGNIQ
jgi:Transcriptional regulator